jgi:hypothetical protein
MADKHVQARRLKRPPSWLGTLAIVLIYAAVMISTNTRFTILDDESDSIAIAGRPVVSALRPFFTGVGFHELHPPEAELLLHFWLVTTHYSFLLLRVFANILFIAAVFFTSKSAKSVAGKPAYWATLLLGFVWPFAFQYGRITGWYCLSMFLLSWVTWAYLGIIEDQSYRPWLTFGIASVLLVWSNYFGFAFLFLLLADFIIFHRNLALRRLRPLLIVMAIIAAAFLPLLKVALQDVATYVAPVASRIDWKNEIAVAGYPSFAIFASAAIAPWFLPLSLPVFLSILVLFGAIWFSRGRRWLVYFVLSMALLDITGNINIKRVPFMLPWLFLAMGTALPSRASRYPRLALSAIAVIVISGWIGIVSGKHYATANLYEPWGKVAEVVAQDARRGAAVVSVNPPFFLYLDYQLGLESDTEAADAAYLGEDLYRSHGYTILQPDDWQTWAGKLHGMVVLVNGSGFLEQVEEQNALNAALRLRCGVLGEYHAAPDPAVLWKARFVKDVPVFAYRTNVIWYDCPR